MKSPVLIAHRGLFEGPDKEKENSPRQIVSALSLGFDCEIDLWRVDEKLYLGHDEPTHLIDFSFLQTSGLWIHAKNLEALDFLLGSGLSFFWHDNDSYTLTSNNYIWTFPGRSLTKNSIAVLPEKHDPKFENMNELCFGICSDFVMDIKNIMFGDGFGKD